MYITETDRINYIISAYAKSGMTKEQIIQAEIQEWDNSLVRQMMVIGEKYYTYNMDIANKKRNNPKLKNNQLQHGFVRKIVDQKIDYLLSKPLSIKTENAKYLELLNQIFEKRFQKQLKKLGKEAINKGIGWLQIYFEDNNICFKVLPSEEVIPLWADNEHTVLDGVIRTYNCVEYEGMTKRTIRHAEYWSKEGVEYYVFRGNVIIPDVEKENVSHFSVNGKPYNWTQIPIIPFKYNDDEMPIIKGLKSLVDDYNYQRSIISDLLSDIPNFIYVLKNYGGVDLKEFLSDLQETNVIKTESDGGVDKLQADIDTTAFQMHQQDNRRNIYEFGRGVDTQNEDMGTASGIALKFRYADLDMDANALDTEFSASLDNVLQFVNQYFLIAGKGDYTKEEVEFVFNRDIIINESEAITECKDSVGIVSNKTLVANHPWVTDVNEELKQLAAEQEEEPDLMQAQKGGADDEEAK